uniref:ProP transporter n=1 Tax=Escherichia coli TaxID=562 RepID=A0A385EN29_ECOLX|nr:proP transporter [Escherichia coli]
MAQPHRRRCGDHELIGGFLLRNHHGHPAWLSGRTRHSRRRAWPHRRHCRRHRRIHQDGVWLHRRQAGTPQALCDGRFRAGGRVDGCRYADTVARQGQLSNGQARPATVACLSITSFFAVLSVRFFPFSETTPITI